MSTTSRLAVGPLLLLALCLPRQGFADDLPPVHVPKAPPSRQELDRLEARRLYALGTLQERKNLLLEAVASFERARRLDPDSAAVLRALAPLYFALERGDDAMAACKRALALDPEDLTTAGIYARQLRMTGKPEESSAVLIAATRSPAAAERPDVAAQLWFDLGQLQEASGEFRQAAASFGKLADLLDKPEALRESARLTREEIAAQSAETYERIGRVNLKAHDPEAASRAFETAQKRDASRAPRLALNLAQVYQSQKKYREALAQAEVFLRSQPQGTEGYELRASLQRRLDRAADVVPDLEKASGRDPHNVALKMLLAREYAKARQHREAERVYLSLLDRQVAGEIYKGLFDLYREEGRRGAEKVLDLLDKSVKLGAGDDKNPGNPGEAASARSMLSVLKDDKELVPLMLSAAVRRLEDERPERRLAHATKGFLAALAARTKQLDHAEKLYRGCLDRPSGPREMEADVYSGLIRVLRLRHKHQAVIDLCKSGLDKAQATNRLLFLTEMGRAYQYLDKHEEAVAALRESVGVANKDQALFCKRMYVDALSGAGKHDKAVEECRALVKEYNQGGDLRDARSSLAAALQAAGKHEEADGQLSLILEADPNDVTANNDLGYVWADRNVNLERAEALVRKAIDLDRKQRTSGTSVGADEEDHAAYVDSLGWVLFRRGKLEEAKAELERASKMPGGEDDPTVWDHLGDVYARLKQPERASAAWRRSLSLYDQRTRRVQAERYREIQEKVKAVE